MLIEQRLKWQVTLRELTMTKISPLIDGSKAHVSIRKSEEDPIVPIESGIDTRLLCI